MGIFDDVVKAATSFVPGGEEIVDEVLPEFDPTSDSAEYGDEVGFAGDAILNVFTDGAAGTAFSDGAEGIEELNDATDNAFTAGNIGDAIGNLV